MYTPLLLTYMSLRYIQQNLNTGIVVYGTIFCFTQSTLHSLIIFYWPLFLS